MAGLFITLEGIEGAGKSTHIDFLQKHLTEQTGKSVLCTREPGGTPLGEAIREQVLSVANLNGISDQTELLLMFAARSQHIEQVIVPALNQDKVVICDRYLDSSMAYQGGGRQLGIERVEALAGWLDPLPVPDMTLLFDLPVELGLQRAAKRSSADRFETERQVFFQRIRYTYLQMAEQQPQRFRIVDASLDIEGVQKQLQTLIAELHTS